MKYIIIINIILFFSCKNQNKSVVFEKSTNIDSVNKSKQLTRVTENIFKKKEKIINDTLLIILNSKKIISVILPENLLEDYEIHVNDNKIEIFNLLYENILGKILKFQSVEPIKEIKYNMKVVFGVGQYFEDKYFDLNYPIYLTTKSIKVKKPIIELPEFSYLEKDVKFGEFFNFKNNRILIKDIERKYLKKIKVISLKKQKQMYENILKNKKKYACCPEFIAEAKEFVAKKENEYKSLNDLNVEIFVKKIQLNIILIDEDLNKNKIEIINANKN